MDNDILQRLIQKSMMKFLVAILLTALLSYISGLFLPWWGIAIAALLVAVLVPQAPVSSFFAGFLGVFLLWAGMAFWFDAGNEGILSGKIANILPLGGNGILLILVTGLIGGLVGGMAAFTGKQLRVVKRS
jgi:hypothetical protein